MQKLQKMQRINNLDFQNFIMMELPIEAYLGTLNIRSKKGTHIKCYSYIDPDYKPHGYEFYDKGYPQQIIHIEFKNLQRIDKAFLSQWTDFTLYNLETYHRWIRSLLQDGFFIDNLLT